MNIKSIYLHYITLSENTVYAIEVFLEHNLNLLQIIQIKR